MKNVTDKSRTEFAARHLLLTRTSRHRRWLVALCSLFLCGCSLRSDPNREFAMSLNGSDYPYRLGSPLGYVREIEAGFSTEYRYSLLFPLKGPFSMPRPGLEITFDPQKIELGREISFGADSESGIHVDYCPLFGHHFNKATMLVYSSQRRDGGGTIRFDAIDPNVGGTVRGKLLHATLYGFCEQAESAQVSEPKSSEKLELRNFPFEVTLERSPF